MGQFFALANLDKKEWVSPGSLNRYSKAIEQADATGLALLILLGTGMGRGGGGFTSPTAADQNDMFLNALNDGNPNALDIGRAASATINTDTVLGRWAGDRIVFVGDYYTPGDVPGVTDENLYRTVTDTFTDLGPQLVDYVNVNTVI